MSNPVDAAAISQEADKHYSTRQWPEAAALYEKALALDEKRLNDWINRGLCLWNMKRNEEALECYERALELDPRSALAWMNRGNVLHDLKRPYEQALACYDRALEIDPNLASAWYNKGDELGWMGNFAAAMLCFEKARDLGFPNAEAMIRKCEEIVMGGLNEMM